MESVSFEFMRPMAVVRDSSITAAPSVGMTQSCNVNHYEDSQADWLIRVIILNSEFIILN